MKDNFEKIEHWLRNNAVKIFNHSLQIPADINEVNRLQSLLDRKLPDDFKQLYLWHNGLNDEKNFGSLFYGMDFFPIDRIISEYLVRKGNYEIEPIPLEKADPEIDPLNLYNTYWIRFAFDGSHTGLYLDLSPTGKGKYGQVIFIDDEYETGILVAGSTEELVENLKNDLENDFYHLDEDALEDGNHYLTTDPEIDIVNWQTSKIWQHWN